MTNGLREPGGDGMSRALSRGLAVVEALAAADENGLGPTAIAATVDIDKATATRILRTLISAGYATQDETTRRYRLTGKILRLAHDVTPHLDLRTVARPHLRRLSDTLNETIHLGIMQGLHIVYLDKLESPDSVQIESALGQSAPIHSTSLGKAIMAGLPDGDLAAILSQLDFQPGTEHTITSPADLLAEIERTRQRGFSTDDRENELGGPGVAAAILEAGGRPVGAVGITGPDFRIRDRFDRLGRAAKNTAQAISRELGAKVDG